MAWAEPQPGGGFRGRYRAPGGGKQTVLQPDGTAWRRKKDAKDAATEAEVKSRRAVPEPVKSSSSYPSTILWGDWWPISREKYADRPTRSNSVEESIARCHLLPVWQHVPLIKIVKNRPNTSIGQVGVEEWTKSPTGLKEREGMSPSYARRILATFSASLASAQEAEIIEVNPCSGLIPAKVRTGERPYLTSAKVTELELREDYEDVLEFEALTGLRPNEVCGLHIHRYDRERKLITVAEVVVPSLKLIRGFPKDSDRRDVPLVPRAIEIIEKYTKNRPPGKCPYVHHKNKTCHSPLVFMTKYNRPMNPETVRQSMNRAVRNRGIYLPGGMYAARHGFGTSSANGGMNIFEVSNLMGHESLETTKKYFHATDDVRDRLTQALEGR